MIVVSIAKIRNTLRIQEKHCVTIYNDCKEDTKQIEVEKKDQEI